MRLAEQDIKTTEVLDWQGIHLIHFSGSSCSQKTRIFLNLKGIDWVSHPLDLAAQNNYRPWFLGINPRGLVPVLVHDGAVHIESNDILEYLDATFREPALIPDDNRDAIVAGLREEDDLHLDIRALTMRFIVPGFLARKKPGSLAAYASDEGTIAGEADPHKAVELDFWRRYAELGITDDQARGSTGKFRAVLERFEVALADATYLCGQRVTLLDIAWFIYAHRLRTAGYPLGRLHPRVQAWYAGLLARDEFTKEVTTPAPLKALTGALHLVQGIRGGSLARVGGL